MDSILTIAALSIFLGIGACYPLRSLMLIERDSHEGPFRSDKRVRYVRFATSGHTQSVAMFDWIRRAFGVYIVRNEFDVEEWVVYERRVKVERFTCPHCLSWWVSLPFSIGLALTFFGVSMEFLAWIFPVHFFIAIVSQVSYNYLWSE